ncbi:uncharacterized protein [Phaseolus vulgaris]|uniref:uncharacterized protein n=1 Tax=Phaseolus vulgaris TaxID=3885 RepID=UPI0035CA903F
MWDTLEVTHEGTNDVKRARKQTFIQEYEMFRMFKGESIAEVQKRFTHIINHLMSLGKTFDKEELNIKILKCLDKSWEPKVTAISKSKDLTYFTTASLFGKLREHELEINRLNVQESEDKHVRNIALKASKHKYKQDSSEEENLSLLSKKFNKFLKRNRNKESNKERYANKKTISSSSSSSSEDEKANLCLMAEGNDDSSSSSSVSSCASLNAENYSQLLQAFKETHEEANRLALSNNRLKWLNNLLKNRVKTLEEELEKSKTDFENLEMHCKNSSLLSNSKVCENCKTLESKIHYLVRTVDKLSKSKSNFEIVLASQKCVFGKSGIMRWIPKSSKNPNDKAESKGPTFVRGPNLVA